MTQTEKPRQCHTPSLRDSPQKPAGSQSSPPHSGCDSPRRFQNASSESQRNPAHSLLALWRNPFAIAYAILYFAFLAVLVWHEGMNPAEPLMILFIVGVGFSLLAWWVTKGVVKLPVHVRQASSECLLLAAYLIVVSVPFLTWGLSFLNSALNAEPMRSAAILLAKLTVFVFVPCALFSRLWHYRLGDFLRLSFSWRGPLRVILAMSAALIALQLVAGNLSPLREADFGMLQWVLGAPFAFVWLVVEVGLVEEFFFRALIQTRLAVFFKSEVAGIVVMCVIFGLAHAPGMYWRTSQTLEALGPSPSGLMIFGYAIIMTSVTGFFLGILWARTRNLAVLALIHAAGDLLPNMTHIIKSWFGW